MSWYQRRWLLNTLTFDTRVVHHCGAVPEQRPLSSLCDPQGSTRTRCTPLQCPASLSAPHLCTASPVAERGCTVLPYELAKVSALEWHSVPFFSCYLGIARPCESFWDCVESCLTAGSRAHGAAALPESRECASASKP
jgi:hypothetical protein